MARLRRLLLRLYHVVRPGAGEPELDRELASHLTLLEDEFIRRGLSSDAARLAARHALGGEAQVKDLHRDARSVRWLDDLRRDLRYAVRTLRSRIGLTRTQTPFAPSCFVRCRRTTSASSAFPSSPAACRATTHIGEKSW